MASFAAGQGYVQLSSIIDAPFEVHDADCQHVKHSHPTMNIVGLDASTSPQIHQIAVVSGL